MKKLLAIALSFSLFALNVNAQVTRNVDPSQKFQRDSSHRRGDKMMKDLDLTDAQKAQLKANREDMKQQSDAIKNDASLTQDQKREKMRELHKSQKDKMNAVLTPDQKTKIQADRQNWNGNRAKKGRGNGMKHLDLNDAQKAQMKANRDEMKKQSDAIKSDASLTEDQKREKIQELHKSRRNKMNSVLTPAQKAKIEARKKEHQENKQG